MTIEQKNISQSLNLFAISSLCSLSAIPASTIHYSIGAGVFAFGIACNAVSARLLAKKDNAGQKPVSMKAQFASAAFATTAGAVSMAGSAFLAIRDIVLEKPAGFVSMGVGFAMATGMISFYGGLRSLAKDDEKPQATERAVSGP